MESRFAERGRKSPLADVRRENYVATDAELLRSGVTIVVDDRRLVHADGSALIDAAQDAATAAWRRFIAKYGGIMAK